EPFFHDADGPVAHTMFVNFDWTAEGLAASAERARELGRDPHRLWAGIDVEARGPGTPVDWAALFGADPAGAVSIGLYRPEWTHTSLPEDAGPEEFHRREEGFGTGPAGRPAPAGEGEWPGIAAHAPDRCAAAELPFGTVFNAGHGTRYAVQGRTASTEAWHHLGVQDVLPPRRWVRRGGRGAAARRRPRLHRALPRRQLPARARSRPGGGRDRPVPGPAGHRRPGRRRGGADPPRGGGAGGARRRLGGAGRP